MLISVILCTYNPSDEILARVLDSVISQDFDRSEWEFLVVDNNSLISVNTRRCIIDRGIQVVLEPIQGLSVARACGVRNTLGSILVFVDDDNLLAPDYLSNVSSAFSDPRIGVVSGAIAPEYETKPQKWFAEFENILAIRQPPSDRAYLTNVPMHSEYFPVGAGMAARREVFESYLQSIAEGAAYLPGRSGSNLTSGEDTDIDFFAISQGYLVGTIGSLKLQHVIPTTRTTLDYISRLTVATTLSAAEVNAKWSHIFGSDVFQGFKISKGQIRFRCVASFLLSFRPKYRVRFVYYRCLLKVVRTGNIF